MKNTFCQVISLSLQRSLHSSHADPDAVVPLLNALTCFLSCEDDLTLFTHQHQTTGKEHQSALLKSFQLHVGLVRDRGTGVGTLPLSGGVDAPNSVYSAGGTGGASTVAAGAGAGGVFSAVHQNEFKLITFPELLQWVWATCGERYEVAVALCRCLGRISMVDKNNKTVGNILSSDLLSILCQSYLEGAGSGEPASHGRKTVAAVSALSLWNIVHHSEKAKGMVRELLKSAGSTVNVGHVRNGGAMSTIPSSREKENRSVMFAPENNEGGVFPTSSSNSTVLSRSTSVSSALHMNAHVIIERAKSYIDNALQIN
jgi:hypothetical protein